MSLKEIEDNIKNPLSNCQCLNPTVFYALQSALSTSMAEAEKILEVQMPIESVELKKEWDFALKFWQKNLDVSAAVLRYINTIPVCKEGGK